MKKVYHEKSRLEILKEFLTPYMEKFTKETGMNIFWMIVGMLVLGTMDSVRSLYHRFLQWVVPKCLNAFYYACSYAERNPKVSWARITTAILLSLIPAELADDPVFLCVDDTLIAKFGTKFECAAL